MNPAQQLSALAKSCRESRGKHYMRLSDENEVGCKLYPLDSECDCPYRGGKVLTINGLHRYECEMGKAVPAKEAV